MAPDKGRGKRKPLTREARFHRQKAAEAAERAKQRDGKDVSPRVKSLSAKGKGKERANDEEEDPHPFRYKSFNDRLASVHIDLSHSLGRGGTGAIAGLDGHGVSLAGLSSAAPMDLDEDDFSDSESEQDFFGLEFDREQRRQGLNRSSIHTKTSFSLALQTWRELNLSLPFSSLLQQLLPLSQSLPLMLHNQDTITQLMSQTLLASNKDSYLGYEPVLDLIPRLAADLGPAFLASYPKLLSATLQTSTVNKLNTESDEHVAALIVERSFESLAATLRCMAPYILRETPSDSEHTQNWLIETWRIVRPYVGWTPQDRAMETAADNGKNKDDAEPRRAKIPPYARRFASEALAHLVRRAKGPQLQEIASAMMNDLAEAVEEAQMYKRSAQKLTDFSAGVAGIWVEASKSVDGHLHSNAVPMISALLTTPSRRDGGVSGETRTILGTLIVTALVHHGDAKTLMPLFSWLESLLLARLDRSDTLQAPMELIEVLEWLTSFIGTRKGKRVSDSAKGSLFALLIRAVPRIHSLADAKLEDGLVHLLTLSIPLGRIQDLIGAGVTLVNELSNTTRVSSSKLYNDTVLALSDSDWSGFRQFVLPSVLEVTSSGLNGSVDSQRDALALLCSLDSDRHLEPIAQQTPTPASTRWMASLLSVVEDRLKNLSVNKLRDVSSYHDIFMALRLAPLLHTRADVLHKSLCDLITRIAMSGAQEGKSNFEASPQNIVEVLCLSLTALTAFVRKCAGLSKLEITEYLLERIDIQYLVSNFAWHRHTVIVLAQLIPHLQSNRRLFALPGQQAASVGLNWALTSTDEELRKSAAIILAAAEERIDSSIDLRPMARIAEIEQIGLSIETIRDRNVRVRALARDLVKQVRSDKESEHQSRSHCLDDPSLVTVHYFTSNLKLNFRPLWEETRNALVDLSTIYDQGVWNAAFEALEATDSQPESPSSWTCSEDRLEVGGDVLSLIQQLSHSVDKQFQDPQLVQRRSLIEARCRARSDTVLWKELASSQSIKGRFDIVNYQAQILTLFTKIPSIAERNNKVFMTYFFATVVEQQFSAVDIEDDVIDEGDEDYHSKNEEATADHGSVRQDIFEKSSSSRPISALERGNHLAKAERRVLLCSYLETFAHFSNPKALYRAEDFHNYLYRLLTRGDNKVQRLALDVILKFKDPALTTYATTLKNLLNPSQFREQLTSLSIAKGPDSSIQPAHRSSLVALLERLFFGIMTSKQSRAQGQANRKASILTSLADLEAEELEELIKVMTEPFDEEANSFDQDGNFLYTSQTPRASARKQAGFIAFLEDVIKHLGLRIVRYWPELISIVLNITRHASLLAEQGEGKSTIEQRSLRQGGLKRLNEFFLRPVEDFDWTQFMPALFVGLVSPRLAFLRHESIQSPSAILDLIHTWSQSTSTVMLLVKYDESLIENVCACLKAPSIKASVIIRVLDIIGCVLDFADEERDTEGGMGTVQERIVLPNSTGILEALASLTRLCDSLVGVEARAIGKDEIFRRLLRLLAQMAGHLEESANVLLLLDLISPLLSRSNALIPEKSKIDVLHALDKLLPMWLRSRPSEEQIMRQYEVFSGLFSKLRSRPARDILCQAFGHLAAVCGTRGEIAELITSLNSFDRKRMGEYDFDRRLAAFDAISVSDDLTVADWLPTLNNLVFFLHEPEEMAIRSSASAALRHYILKVKDQRQNENEISRRYDSMFTSIVYNGLRRALRSASPLVQREAVELLGFAAFNIAWLPYLSEMQGLLVEGDDEASFFNNVYHIQMHRRLRALLRLGQEARKGTLTTRTINEVFLPLIEQLLNSNNNHGDGNLIGHAVECLGLLSSRLNWGPYNVLLWRYLSRARSDEEDKKISTKVSVRASMSILDNFHFQMDEEVVISDEDSSGAARGGRDNDGIEASVEPIEDRNVAKSIDEVEQSRKVLDAVLYRLLPKLMEFFDLRDELEDAVRLPIAIGVARVLLRLPLSVQRVQTTRLLSVLANVFKSKAQDTRNLARTTLASVATTLGPEYFPIIVRELRKALTRGPQVSVLAFTVHNILIHCMEPQNGKVALSILKQGTRDIVDIVIEDIFGHTAEDRQSIENRTTYREVKSFKSLDTIEHVARVVDKSHISILLQPIRNLMSQTEALQAVKGFDDYLRRVAVGLHGNANVETTDYLILCHSLLTSSSTTLAAQGKASGKGVKKASAVLASRLKAESGLEKDHYAQSAHRFVALGLDLLFSSLRHERFDAADQGVLMQLDPLVTNVGNCLFAQQTAVVATALRTISLMIRLPLMSVKTAIPVLVKQALKLLERESNAQSELALGSVKLLGVIIRDRKDLEVRPSDAQLSALCRYIDANLDETTDIQGTLFQLLRALMARKYIVSDLYDALDKVASLLVVHQSESVRASARATYVDFLLDLPHGHKRFSNQMHFLAKNLSYAFESGRLNVLETVRLLVDKGNEEILRPFIDLFFVALVMRLANDDSVICRERAAALIAKVIQLCQDDELTKLLQITQSWSEADTTSNRNLVRVAMMVSCIFADTSTPSSSLDKTWMRKAFAQANKTLHLCANELTSEEAASDTFDGNNNLDWNLPYQVLQFISRVHRQRQMIWTNSEKGTNSPERAMTPVWKPVQTLILFPHSWVRLSACRLLGEHLSSLPAEAPEAHSSADAGRRSLGDLVDLARKLSLAMRSPNLDDELALQIVKNLVFIGKCFAFVDAEASYLPSALAGGSTSAEEGGDSSHEESSSESELDEDVEENEKATQGELWQSQPLRWLFIRLSNQIRTSVSQGALTAGSAKAASSILKWMAAMISQHEAEQSKRYILYIVAPIFRILEGGPSESSAARNGSTREMTDAASRRSSVEALASEVQDLVQSRLGTTVYTSAYAQVKRRALDRRRQRRATDIQRAIDFPQAALARKAVRNQRKHESRKRKHQSFAKAKDRVRPSKRQR